MKLYFFSYYKGKFTKKIQEVEEKPKTYRGNDIYGFYRQYKKEDIGKIDSHTLFLDEDNVEKAKELFLEKMKDDINWKKSRISSAQRELRQMESELENLEKGNFEIESGGNLDD